MVCPSFRTTARCWRIAISRSCSRLSAGRAPAPDPARAAVVREARWGGLSPVGWVERRETQLPPKVGGMLGFVPQPSLDRNSGRAGRRDPQSGHPGLTRSGLEALTTDAVRSAGRDHDQGPTAWHQDDASQRAVTHCPEWIGPVGSVEQSETQRCHGGWRSGGCWVSCLNPAYSPQPSLRF